MAACSGTDEAPSRLLDGSPTRVLPIDLEGISAPPVLTSVRLLRIADLEPGSATAFCFRRHRSATPAARIVERTGVYTETVTFRDRPGHALYGCDNSTGPREGDRRWCGGAFGRLYSGRLRDPRLDLGCTTEDEEMVGFVWVEPHPDAVYIAVEQTRYVEVHRVAGDVPVRVAATAGVEIEGSRATFVLSEHDAEGGLLRRYELDAAVAG